SGRHTHARPRRRTLRASHRQTHECMRPKGWQRIPTGQVPLHAGNTPPPHLSNVVVLGGRVVVVLVVVDVVVVAMVAALVDVVVVVVVATHTSDPSQLPPEHGVFGS